MKCVPDTMGTTYRSQMHAPHQWHQTPSKAEPTLSVLARSKSSARDATSHEPRRHAPHPTPSTTANIPPAAEPVGSTLLPPPLDALVRAWPSHRARGGTKRPSRHYLWRLRARARAE